MNQDLPYDQDRFRKGRRARDQIANICWIIGKARKFQKKKSTSASVTMLKPLTVWITANYGRFLKRWEYQTTWFASWETCMEVKKQYLEPDMEQQTGSKLGKEYTKAVCISSPFLFNLYAEYIIKILHWINHRLESRLPGEISTISDMQMIPL